MNSNQAWCLASWWLQNGFIMPVPGFMVLGFIMPFIMQAMLGSLIPDSGTLMNNARVP